jgi:hypothetical protein
MKFLQIGISSRLLMQHAGTPQRQRTLPGKPCKWPLIVASAGENPEPLPRGRCQRAAHGSPLYDGGTPCGRFESVRGHSGQAFVESPRSVLRQGRLRCASQVERLLDRELAAGLGQTGNRVGGKRCVRLIDELAPRRVFGVR